MLSCSSVMAGGGGQSRRLECGRPKKRATDRIRTDDLALTKRLLYRLSYGGVNGTLITPIIPQLRKDSKSKGSAEELLSLSAWPKAFCRQPAR